MIFRTQWSQLFKFCLSSVPVLVLLLALSAPLLPQSQGDNRLFNDNGGQLSDFERQRRMDRDMEQRGSGLRYPEARAIAGRGYFWGLAAIQKNTARLREANGDLQQAILPSQTPDYKSIAKYASKIRDLTSSLQSHLYIPKAKTPKNQLPSEPTFTIEQLRTSVQALDRLVAEFLSNQAVQRPGIVNTYLRVAASEEARDLITESKKVKKLADALRTKQ
ncbi:MAG: hypothetical protein QOD75_15 [Blastocatellia bacterium]|jgi:hypothetical protein|nr:hypothetical protein [Blastocatellia bacterium]